MGSPAGAGSRARVPELAVGMTWRLRGLIALGLFLAAAAGAGVALVGR